MSLADKIYNYLSAKEQRSGSESELFNIFFTPNFRNNFIQHKILNYLLENDGRFRFDCSNKQWCAGIDSLSINLDEVQYCAIDVETTGFNEHTDRITEISAIKLYKGEITTHISHLINPRRCIPRRITTLTGITDNMLFDKHTFDELAPHLIEFIGESVILAHHSNFDTRFINAELERAGHTPLENPSICTCKLARKLYPFMNNYSLDTVAKLFELKFVSRHRAYGDALMVIDIFLNFMPLFKNYGIYSLRDLLKYLK